MEHAVIFFPFNTQEHMAKIIVDNLTTLHLFSVSVVSKKSSITKYKVITTANNAIYAKTQCTRHHTQVDCDAHSALLNRNEYVKPHMNNIFVRYAYCDGCTKSLPHKDGYHYKDGRRWLKCACNDLYELDGLIEKLG